MSAGLFNNGHFRLHSGGMSSFKIDCDALTDGDLAALAVQVAARFRWHDVIGIPKGGDRFAQALARWNVPCADLPRLLVDDVWTTGRSMEDRHSDYHRDIGVVVFARSETPDWVHPIFQLWPAGAPS